MGKRIVFLLGIILLFCLKGNADTVPAKPYVKDSHTLFLCHFDSAEEIKSLGGEIPEGVTFEKGKFGNGFLTDKKGEYISFPSEGKINKDKGTIEMWVKPVVDLNSIKYPDDPHPYLFHLFKNERESMYIYYNAHNRTIVFSIHRVDKNGKEESCYPQAVCRWKAGELHHIAFTWGKGAFIYLDGKMVAMARFEKGLNKIAPKIYFGATTWHSNPALMVIDEVRISNIQRVFSQPVEEW